MEETDAVEMLEFPRNCNKCGKQDGVGRVSRQFVEQFRFIAPFFKVPTWTCDTCMRGNAKLTAPK